MQNSISRRGVLERLGLMVTAAPLAGCDAGMGASFGCRVTAIITAAGKFYTGSSVIAVRSRKGIVPFAEGAKLGTAIQGEAVVVTTPDGLIFFSLDVPPPTGTMPVAIVETFLGRVHSTDDFYSKAELLGKQVGRKAILGKDKYPNIVYFRDIARPETIVLAFSQDLHPPMSIAAEAVQITLEITNDPPTHKIYRYLPWLRTISEEQHFKADHGPSDWSFAATATRRILIRGE